MAPRKSTRMKNDLTVMGYRDLFTGGEGVGYTGVQPATADAAPTGTKLVVITDNGSARTPEVCAYGTVTLNSGSSGSVDQITVTPTGGSAINLLPASVSYNNSSLTQTAADVVHAINRFKSFPIDFRASSSGAVITIKAFPGLGTVPNGWALASTVTTIGKTDVNFANGVAAVNGLTFDAVVSGLLALYGTWKGTGLATGNLGYIRLKGSVVDDDSDDSTNNKFVRYDMSVGTSGADINLEGGTGVTSGVDFVLNSGGITIPSGA